eukprot:1990831-Pyramimonas_sp.AAC.3
MDAEGFAGQTSILAVCGISTPPGPGFAPHLPLRRKHTPSANHAKAVGNRVGDPGDIHESTCYAPPTPRS